MSLLYEVRGLVRRYGRVTALDLPALGVDELRIHSGQVLTLVGYNGSGKSTLLRLLAFLEEPDEGRIIYHGGEDPRREVSLLLQEPYLLKTTVFENVVLGLKLRGRRDGLEDAYQAAMRQVGFDDPDAMRRRGPNALSGGERQRVALASRLVLRPRALLLDEPTSNVDVRSARAIAAAGPKARPSSVPPTIPRSCRPWAGNSSNWARAGAWKARGPDTLSDGEDGRDSCHFLVRPPALLVLFKDRAPLLKNTLLLQTWILPGKSVFFVVFYEIFLRISASRAASLPEACPFWGGAGPEACLFFRFLDQFFFAGLRWVKLDGCTAELPCFASIKGEFHVPFPAGQHGRQDLCV